MPTVDGCEMRFSHHPRNPGMIRLPCIKYQQTVVYRCFKVMQDFVHPQYCKGTRGSPVSRTNHRPWWLDVVHLQPSFGNPWAGRSKRHCGTAPRFLGPGGCHFKWHCTKKVSHCLGFVARRTQPVFACFFRKEFTHQKGSLKQTRSQIPLLLEYDSAQCLCVGSAQQSA